MCLADNNYIKYSPMRTLLEAESLNEFSERRARYVVIREELFSRQVVSRQTSIPVAFKKKRGVEGNKGEAHYYILLVWGQWTPAAGSLLGILAQARSWRTLFKKEEEGKRDCQIYKGLTTKLISTHYKCIIIFTRNHFKWRLFITLNFHDWERSPHPLPQIF